MIRDAEKSDVKSICSIYNFYVKNTVITLRKSPFLLRK